MIAMIGIVGFGLALLLCATVTKIYEVRSKRKTK